VNQSYKQAASKLNLEEGLAELLAKPEREIAVTIPVLMDDGTIRTFHGYRVQHSNARGPYKGGIRYDSYFMDEAGTKVVAVSDMSCGLASEDGLPIAELMKFVSKPGALLSSYKSPGVRRISNEELLTLDVDVLIPAALEGQIIAENASKIKAKLISEGANGPTTFEADPILSANGVTVIADILANAGGVVVSYFEWVQNLQGVQWTLPDVMSKLEVLMNKAVDDTWDLAAKEKVSLRIAAFMLAIKRVAAAVADRFSIAAS
jgi:glutamate dehydrogenase/leucine dehydrogenase